MSPHTSSGPPASNSVSSRNGPRFVATLALFSVVGPFVGSVAFVLAGFLKPGLAELGPALGAASALTALFSPFALVAGFLPAHLTGWIAAMVALETHSKAKFVGASALTGGLSSLLLLLAFVGEGAFAYALAGITAGGVCAVLCLLLRLAPRPQVSKRG